MCGIVGYVGPREALPLLMGGLRRLEYRGYDSAGVAVQENGTLEVLHLMRAEGRTLAELADEMKFWPQVTRNVKAARRREWEENDTFRAAKESAEAKLGSTGRLLVRPSGTEPVLRITVEAQSSTVASSTAKDLAEVAAKELA